MTDQFVAEIRVFPFNFAPTGWAFCNGQILLLSQNTALFSLLGTTYGGDGRSNFALPNLQGSLVVGAGQGPGLQLWELGETQGSSQVTLLQTEMPSHTHPVTATNARSSTASGTPGSGLYLAAVIPGSCYVPSSKTDDTTLAATSLSITGGGQPHNNLQPGLALNFCVALQGIFPARG